MNPNDPASPRLSDFLCFAIYSANLAYGRAYKPILEELGLTYEEYTLELLERGRYLQREDVDRIDAIKRKRPL